MTPVTIAQFRAGPTVDLMTAARARPGPHQAHDLARQQLLPCPVLRIGDTYRVPTAGLLEVLGLPPDGARPKPCRPVRLTAATLETLIASMPVPLMVMPPAAAGQQPPGGRSRSSR